jgi:hypothetical protein
MWKDIIDYEGRYQVSDQGELRSLRQQSFERTKLIATAKNDAMFIPNPENKPFVDHINGNRADDRVVNLRWVTQKENMQNVVKEKCATCGRARLKRR